MTLQTTSARTLTPVKFKSDPQNSTYRWEYDMTQNGVNRVPLIEGYSKGQGFELTNKAELLIRKLTNPLSMYLDRTDEIRVFENLMELPNGQLVRIPKGDTAPLLVMTRQGYTPFGWVKECDPILNELEKIYIVLKATGRPPQDRSVGVRKNVWFPELDHSKYNFTTLQELKTFCRAMVPRFGQPCMTKWWTAHLAMQPELTQPEAAGPAIIQATPTSDEQRVTQEQLQQLYGKYNNR